MRVENVHINSLGVALHEWVSAEQAVADGLLGPEVTAANGLTGTHVAGDVPAVDLAVSAARAALERTELDPDEIASHLHSAVYYQGPAGSYPPGYIQRELGLDGVSALYLQQGCNGMLGALEVAIGQLTGAAQTEAVLLTTGENFSSPDIDRWTGYGQSYFLGDGGAAAVLSAEEGFAEVRSLHAGLLPALEKWHRGDGPMLLRGESGSMADMAERAERFAETELSLSETLEKLSVFNLGIIHRALVDADLNASDLAKVVPIHTDGRMIEYSVMAPLGLPMSKSSFDFGRGVGHVGGADVFLALEHLVRTGEVGPGDHVLLVSQGPGWICTACVVIISDLPAWTV
ncbi:ketoacyl-ACP synthase III family protein [Streptomyces nigrescens]|uniref:Ketoacyl-ACP synthase III family protein n=1 Tax=Streptomyces nigrescens TaxID=1920 RepID=A0ABY7JFZ3_STRNI|nr:ketoacyl-ACP synthase III family protein [Streptomyces nigrescens]WAU08869.1 ketoacyl-ACP synthase III family protein [Streptomyces nigrescens]